MPTGIDALTAAVALGQQGFFQDFSLWKQALGGPLLWIISANATDCWVAAAASLMAALALALALHIDWRWGEPPARWHPVVWMGTVLGWLGDRIAPTSETLPQELPIATSVQNTPLCARGFGGKRDKTGHFRVLGALAWCAQAFVWTGIFAIFQLALFSLSAWAGMWALALGAALAIKPLLAWRMLRDEVAAVDAALTHSTEAGRARLRWLVSRDTTNLPPEAVREAAIETLAENLSDALIAALLWFAIFGLAGAALYRFANTADAMWGYPAWRKKSSLNKAISPKWQYWRDTGWWAARADDWLNWPAARLTALGLFWAGFKNVKNKGFMNFFKDLRQNAAQTPSPNGGWPMGAMALLLGLRLSKPATYVLNVRGAAPERGCIARALALAQSAARRLIWTILLGICTAAFWIVAISDYF